MKNKKSNVKQMDIFEVLEEETELEYVKHKLPNLKPGQEIATKYLTVRAVGNLIEVEFKDVCHEVFRSKEKVLNFIVTLFRYGVDY